MRRTRTAGLRLVVALLAGAAVRMFSPAAALADNVAKQVEIEAKLVELSDKDTKALGVDFGNLPANPPGTLGAGGITLTQAQVDSILKSIEESKGAKVTEAPDALTPNGTSTGVNFSTADGRGVKLDLRPRVQTNGSIMLEVVPTTSGAAPVTLPAVGVGQTAVLTGTEGKGNAPLMIGQIPLVGSFSHKGPKNPTPNLIIFITPHLVNVGPYDDDSGGGGGGDSVNFEAEGTGETIGHVADLTVQNKTNQPLDFWIPPLILESKSGKNQDVACPYCQQVDLAPGEKKTIPVTGACLDRDKPAADKGSTGDLIINTGDPKAKADSGFHIPADKVREVLRIEWAIFETVDNMAKQDEFKDFPNKDKDEQKRIVQQWATWSDPRLSEITENPPATRNDMKDVVKKQQHDPINSTTEKKIDKGVDNMFDKIELTGKKAKDLEGPEPQDEGMDDGGVPPTGESIPVGNPTPTATPMPKTKAKPTPTATPKKSAKTKDKPTVTPTPEPKEEGAVSEDDPGRGETEEVELPKPKYQYKKEIDCGTIIIDVGTKGDLIFEFTPKASDKCPCKKFGWVQHVAPDGYNSWNYDNGAKGAAGKGGKGAPSDPNKPNQPTQPPAGKKPEDWSNNPWYGGTNDPNQDPGAFAGHPTPQTKISDRPTLHNQKFRTQLVCVATGEVYFTWAWGPVAGENTALDSVGAKEVPPPPVK